MRNNGETTGPQRSANERAMLQVWPMAMTTNPQRSKQALRAGLIGLDLIERLVVAIPRTGEQISGRL